MAENLDPEMAFGLLMAGCIFFPSLFLLQQRFWMQSKVGGKLRTKYNLLEKDCADVSNKVVSAVQAVMATTAGAIVCANCANNVLSASHPMTLIYSWFGIPYFAYDTGAMFYVYRMTLTMMKKQNKDQDQNQHQHQQPKQPNTNFVIDFFKFACKAPVIFVHHVILSHLGFMLILFFREGNRNGDFFVGIVFLMEASTPFVSLRFILSKFKLKSSLMYTINGVLMLILFPIFRIASVFHTVYLYAQQNNLEYLEAWLGIPFGWKVVIFVSLAPQIYWYFCMWKGLIKMIRVAKAQGEEKADQLTAQLIMDLSRESFESLTFDKKKERDNGVKNKTTTSTSTSTSSTTPATSATMTTKRVKFNKDE